MASVTGGIGYLLPPVTWSTAVTLNTNAWISWNTAFGGLCSQQMAATNYTTNAVVWNSWIQIANIASAGAALAQQPPVATPQQRVQMAAADRAYRLSNAKHELNRMRAVRRARRLLEEILSPEQREQLRAHGFFLVQQGTHTYRINRGKTHNVYLVDANGHAIENLCIIPDDHDRVPEEDCMIAQKLLLEADHNAFRTIANIGRYVVPQRPLAPLRPETARDWLRAHGQRGRIRLRRRAA